VLGEQIVVVLADGGHRCAGSGEAVAGAGRAIRQTIAALSSAPAHAGSERRPQPGRVEREQASGRGSRGAGSSLGLSHDVRWLIHAT